MMVDHQGEVIDGEYSAPLHHRYGTPCPDNRPSPHSAAHQAYARFHTPPHQATCPKDTRLSGYMFESALESGLSAAGVDCWLLGPMPTPAIAYLTKTFNPT
jgi:hypothetical protein